MNKSPDETLLRRSLQSRLGKARACSDDLFDIVRNGAMHERPIPERHRILFYLGHLEAFDWNLICRDSLCLPSFNREFDKLFAFGIDPVDGNLPADKPSDWPALDQIHRYNREVRDKVDACLMTESLESAPTENFEKGWAFNIAIEHRLMHVETLAYMLHWLPYEKKNRRVLDLNLSGPVSEASVITIPAGTATLGMDRGRYPEVGWDNEYPEHSVEVPAFVIDAHNVTNADFLEFVLAGGYDERSLWADEDWDWRIRLDRRYPLFWTCRGQRWYYHGIFEEIPLPRSWPVYVSHAEASAYARWRGKSLPTEAQFHRAAFGTPKGEERAYPWGSAAPAASFGNFDLRRWEPDPVGSHPSGTSAYGVSDLVGNGWEWTSSKFEPFQGFEPLPFYRTYSADFFDGKHYVIKGGSARTAAPLLRRSFRNWFQPHYPYIYAGFRCVEN